MPHHAPWRPEYRIGHEPLDRQHQSMLAQCERLGECCRVADAAERERSFDAAFAELEGLARAHFEAELALLAERGCAELEAHRADCEEFDFLVGEVATTGNFDRLELQRFITLWCIGHVAGAAPMLRDLLGDAAQATTQRPRAD